MPLKCVVFGAGGFIGAHLVKRLKAEGHWVRGVDLKRPPFAASPADDFQIADLRDDRSVYRAIGSGIDRVYQLATDMGGAGYIFTGDHDAEVMWTGNRINSNTVRACRDLRVGRIFFASSACVYNHQQQETTEAIPLTESLAYPAWPDSEYGWEKLFAERMYLAWARQGGSPVTIARFHSIVGPEGTWRGGKEKVFAAVCRKVAEAEDGGTIQVWGDGLQTRTFLYIDECLEGIERLLQVEASIPVNLGSSTLITIDGLVECVAAFAGKTIDIQHVEGPQGVRGRQTDHTTLHAFTGWTPDENLLDAVAKTYRWIAQQVAEAQRAGAL